MARPETLPLPISHPSRKDDVIVFSTGEKTNPIDVEERIPSLPGIAACLVAGHKHPYPILLIELAATASPPDVLPHLHQALDKLNKQTEKHAKINPGNILIAVPEKPFARTPKGTIIRSQANKLYEAEIRALYSSAAETADRALPGQIELDMHLG
ncbi:hypothetical protein BDV06DRAFT_225419 [Aspergillus oleicola]